VNGGVRLGRVGVETYPECIRWTDRPIKRSAGQFNLTDGRVLPGVAEYLKQRDALYEVCRQRALRDFSIFGCMDAGSRPHGRVKSAATEAAECVAAATAAAQHRRLGIQT